MHEKFRVRQIDVEIGHLLASASSDLDDLAIENEAIFLRRFGFDRSRFWRVKIIEFKRKRDLSDLDIRALHRNRMLRFGNGALEIDESGIMPALGWLQLAILTLPIAHFGCAFWRHAPPSLIKFFTIAAIAAIYFAMPTLVYWFYISPSRVWKRHLRDKAQNLVTPIDR